MIKDLKYPTDVINALFPAMGDEGQDVRASEDAANLVRTVLALEGEVQWKLPDVFSVRYGSSYVATGSIAGHHVRFHSEEGEFREGDDN